MIRPATPADVPGIYQLIRDLAEYERALPHVTGTREQLRAALFGPDPAVFAYVAEHQGQLAGFALWFLNFSTWECQHGVYLEDLYVRPDLRGHGYGRQLLAELAALCVERGYGRLAVVRTGLERAGHRLLPHARRAAHGRVDHLPAVRTGARATWPPPRAAAEP